MSYTDGKTIVKEDLTHRGHDVRYLGTNEDDTDDLHRCYDCHPPFWHRWSKWILFIWILLLVALPVGYLQYKVCRGEGLSLLYCLTQ